MEAPEYLICISCETPCYTFEWSDDKIAEVMCMVCGAEDPDEFVTEEEFEAMTSEG